MVHSTIALLCHSMLILLADTILGVFLYPLFTDFFSSPPGSSPFRVILIVKRQIQ
jgi:hypothetical protein